MHDEDPRDDFNKDYTPDHAAYDAAIALSTAIKLLGDDLSWHERSALNSAAVILKIKAGLNNDYT